MGTADTEHGKNHMEKRVKATIEAQKEDLELKSTCLQHGDIDHTAGVSKSWNKRSEGLQQKLWKCEPLQKALTTYERITKRPRDTVRKKQSIARRCKQQFSKHEESHFKHPKFIEHMEHRKVIL